jgi:hypothetical protein
MRVFGDMVHFIALLSTRDRWHTRAVALNATFLNGGLIKGQAGRGLSMPRRCRAPTDAAEAAQIRKLAQSHHVLYDCKQRAHQMIALSWEGLRTGEIASHLRCHPQTVRERFERFQTEGIDGLTNRPGAGRKARLTERERSQLIALVAQTPGRPQGRAQLAPLTLKPRESHNPH